MIITVVCTASYPVPIASGRHIAPGEVAKTEKSDAVERDIQNGLLAEAIKPEKTPTRKSEPSTALDDLEHD